MKFAILGTTPQAIRFVARAAQLGHEFVAAYDATLRSELREAAPTISIRDDWENLLGSPDVDAVLVAGPLLPDDLPADLRERRDDQLRKLFQAAIPLVVISPVCEAIVGFELEMIRRDVHGIVVSAIAAPLHAAFDELQQLIATRADQELGSIELVQIERSLSLPQRSDVLAAFASDAELLRRLAGPLKRLTASGGKAVDGGKPSLANLVVHADGDANFPVRWSVGRAGQVRGAKLTVQGTNDQITLSMPPDDSWELVGPGKQQKYEVLDSVQVVLDELASCLANNITPEVTWLDACRAAEAMEAIDRSLARGRAIDLYNEDHSEESSFKGIMAAGGCLMLLGTLAAFFCAGLLSLLYPPEKRGGAAYWGWLQFLLITPLALFLLAQLLSFGLTRHRSQKTDEQGPAKFAD